MGKKYLMALTGLGLLVFVIVHMLGNLQVFLGPEPLNSYANLLQHTPGILWPTRIGLVVLVALHVTTALRLSRENKQARPVDYARNQFTGSTYASRTMLLGGLMVACFVIYHLLHFTVEVPALNLTGYRFKEFYDPPGDPTGKHNVYMMMIVAFRQPLVSAFYLLGMICLFLHLRHGLSSLVQSIGWRTPTNARLVDGLAWIFAGTVLVGNCSIPIAILLGYGKDVQL